MPNSQFKSELVLGSLQRRRRRGRHETIAFLSDTKRVLLFDIVQKTEIHEGLLEHAGLYGMDRLHAFDNTGFPGFDKKILPVKVYCQKSVFGFTGADNQSARDADICSVAFGAHMQLQDCCRAGDSFIAT